MDLDELKYPIGTYKPPTSFEQETIDGWIKTLEKLPEVLRGSVENLSYECLDWPYRPNGWTIKQVVHHLADSHMNCLIRFKLALTEEKPTIRPYVQDKWAVLPDANNAEIATSLMIVEGVHARLAMLLRELKPEDWGKMYHHPEYDKEFSIAWMLGLYAWHSNHHIAHIKQAIEEQGDFVWAD